MMPGIAFETCPLCGSDRLEPSFRYDAPPAGETGFPFAPGSYRRCYRVCAVCGHFSARTDMDLSQLYSGAYVDATYGDAEGLRAQFERIVSLPADRSDNAGRVARIAAFRAGGPAWPPAGPSLLDVGSGLAVFPHAMRLAGWRCTALDPDPRAAAHARAAAGVCAIAADFTTAAPAELGRHDLVSFNKVLEHVRNPVAMLARSRHCLRPGGVVYLELPDGEAAAVAGPGRQEFFIEHFHVFSPASLALLARRAGLRLLQMERLREPSGKYTLRAFLAA